MIIVWGSAEATPQDLGNALELSLEHVRRSREEPGCLRHSAQIDAENPNRIVFYEEWQDMASLQAHFEVPASADFVRLLSALTVEAPEMQVYEAKRLR